MYLALLLAITFGCGLILHAVASLISWGIWHVFSAPIEGMPPRLASRFLLFLRMSPLAVALIATAFFIVPSFLKYEPHGTLETIPFTLQIFAALAVAGLLAGLYRAVSALLQSHRIMRQWMCVAQPHAEQIEGVCVYRCQLDSPVIAVMGMFPARIFAAQCVVDALSPDEFTAALRHEAVHCRSFDILKKMFLQFAPAAFLGVDLLQPVAAHWSRMCELAADEESVIGHAPQILHLASALVKVARLAKPHSECPALSAALYGRETLLSHRVRRLLEISEDPGVIAAGPVAFDARRILVAGGCILAIVFAVYPQVLTLTHDLLEFVVRV